MDYEKKYEEALNLAKSYYGKSQNEFLDTIFPELRDSEDEKIRKTLIGYFTRKNEYRDVDELWEGWEISDILAWLEKQKDQKPLPGFDDLTPDEKMNHPLYLECFDVGRRVGQVEAEQKPAEWSEVDLQHKSWILECLADGERKMPEYAEDFRAAYNWLKSLRPRPRWKPSEEQMEALSWAINYLTDIEPDRASTLALLKFNLKSL